MKSKSYLVLSAVAVFALYLVLLWVLRLATGKLPIEDGILDIYRDHDFAIAFAIAGLVTLALAQIQKRKLKK